MWWFNFFIFWESSILLSTVAALVYIPTSSVQELPCWNVLGILDWWFIPSLCISCWKELYTKLSQILSVPGYARRMRKEPLLGRWECCQPRKRPQPTEPHGHTQWKGRDFLGSTVVKALPSNAGGMGMMPGRKAKIPHAYWTKTEI